MEGKIGYKPKPGMENRWHVIGDGGNPIAIMRKHEVAALFSPFFYYVFELWRKFNAGFGLPEGLTWDAVDPDVIEAMEIMENHFNQYFSMSKVITLYMEALIKRFDQLAEILVKRG